MCPNIQCMATNCEKCHQQGNCLWTRFVFIKIYIIYISHNLLFFIFRQMHTSEFGTFSTSGSLYDWSCSNLDLNQRSNIKIKNSSICPERCSAHKSCETCLSSQVKYS